MSFPPPGDETISRRTRGTRYGRVECPSAARPLAFVMVFVTASLARAAFLETVSPLEMLASVMGPPIAMPSTMGGALGLYLVAGLPWVPLPTGTSSSPTRRTVTFLPVETGQPMCTVDVRRPSASCVSLADATLVPVLTGVETSVVDPDAPLLIVSKSTLALVARNGSTLASRSLTALPFRNLTQFGSVWHVDLNISSAEAIIYHSTSTQLFVDIVNVELSSAAFVNATIRLHYFTALGPMSRPVPSQFLEIAPCLGETTVGEGDVGVARRLRSAVLRIERPPYCMYTVPDYPSTSATPAQTCRSALRTTGLCSAVNQNWRRVCELSNCHLRWKCRGSSLRQCCGRF